jgi:serine/threonine protein phosphatase PrpC
VSATNSASEPFPEEAAADGHLEAQGLGTVAWVTDVGHVRGRNEDRLLVKSVWGGSWLLLLVADGAGGHDSGDKAAEQVVSTFHACFPAEGEPPEGDADRWLNNAITRAHGNVRGLAEGQARPPASTVVGVLIERDSLCGWRFHVGDSRLYVRQPAGMVAQWTRDHNITNGLIDRGLPVAQALRIADGGRLTQVLGGVSDPEPEVLGPLKFDPGTVLLLCSDGVYGHNGDREVLIPVMKPEGGDVVQRAADLKQAVLDGDAPDNLTAVLWEVPADAVSVRDRETVTNSMRSVTAEDVEKALARKVRQQLGLGPGPDDVPQAAPTPPPVERSSGGLRWPLVAAVVIVAAIAIARSRRPEPPPAPTPMAEEGELPDSGLRTEPMPPEQPRSDALAELIRGFDPALLPGMEPARRDEVLRLLAELLSVRQASWATLTSPMDGSTEYTMDGWPQPGGRNDERAAAAWAARGVLLSRFPEVSAQPGVADALAAAACSRVEVSWPRGESQDPGEALQLAPWLAACLDAPGSSVQVRLGGWPTRGWSMEELNQAKFLASRNDPDGLLRYADAESARILELSLLAAALRQPVAAGLDVEIVVVQPPGDFSEGNVAEERVVQAAGRAHEIVGMLRSAVGDSVRIHGTGRVSDDLTAVFGATSPTPEQQVALDDLNRRVVVVLRRPVADDDEELPDSPPEDDEELPDATPGDELPHDVATDVAPAGSPTP